MDQRIVVGIFNGEHMDGMDGKIYPVLANYASKSKLVEGDKLKLTIGIDGNFIYKQIGPVARLKIIGIAIYTGRSIGILAENKLYRILSSAVTYFKIMRGDSVAITIPRNQDSCWAAVEAKIESVDNNF